MSYLNLDENYFEHIKIKRLVMRLGFGAELIPLQLWCHAAHYFPDTGTFKNYTAEEIKGFCKWNGDASCMLVALLELEILLKTSEGVYQINDWDEHQGHIVSFKIRGQANAKKRWDKYRDNRNASSIADSNAGSNAPTYYTKPTIPTKPKEKHIFTPPNLEDVSNYCLERNNGINPSSFIDYYQARGWKFKTGQPMKDWKAAVRTWEKNNTKDSGMIVI